MKPGLYVVVGRDEWSSTSEGVLLFDTDGRVHNKN